MRCRKLKCYILLPSEENVMEPAPSCSTGGAIKGSTGGGCSGEIAAGSGTVFKELKLGLSFGDPRGNTAPSNEAGKELGGDGESRPFFLLGFGRRVTANMSVNVPPGDDSGGVEDCVEPGSFAEWAPVAEFAELTGPPCDAGAVDCNPLDRGPEEAAVPSKTAVTFTEDVADPSRSSRAVVVVVRELTSSSWLVEEPCTSSLESCPCKDLLHMGCGDGGRDSAGSDLSTAENPDSSERNDDAEMLRENDAANRRGSGNIGLLSALRSAGMGGGGSGGDEECARLLPLKLLPRLLEVPLCKLRRPAAAKRISRLAGVPPAELRRLVLFLLPLLLPGESRSPGAAGEARSSFNWPAAGWIAVTPEVATAFLDGLRPPGRPGDFITEFSLFTRVGARRFGWLGEGVPGLAPLEKGRANDTPDVDEADDCVEAGCAATFACAPNRHPEVPCSAINVSKAKSDNDGVVSSEDADGVSCSLLLLSIRDVTYLANSTPFKLRPTYIFDVLAVP